MKPSILLAILFFLCGCEKVQYELTDPVHTLDYTFRPHLKHNGFTLNFAHTFTKTPHEISENGIHIITDSGNKIFGFNLIESKKSIHGINTNYHYTYKYPNSYLPLQSGNLIIPITINGTKQKHGFLFQAQRKP